MFLAFPWCAKTSKAANRRLGGSYSRHRHHGGRRRTKKPAKVGGPPVHAFFSIHDTFDRTNLRTAKECNGDEIAKLVKKRPGESGP